MTLVLSLHRRLSFLVTVCCVLTEIHGVNRALYESIADEFESIIEKNGFSINHGKMVMDKAEQCGHSGDGNYGTYEIPTAPNEFTVDLNTACEHRFGPTEAVVFMCQTPPSEAEYFSYTHFLSTKIHLGRSKKIEASLSDSINPINVNVLSKSDEPKDSFGKDIAIITTASQETLNIVKAALIEAGVPDGVINYQVISADVVDIGLSKGSDSIGFIHHVIGLDEQSGYLNDRSVYLDDPKCTVVRLTPGVGESRSGVQAYKPFPPSERAPNGSGDDEDYLRRPLNKVERSIKTSIIAKYQTVNAATVSQAKDPESCISKFKPCSGDNSDAITFTNFPGMPYHTNSFYILYGVNHVQTGFATVQTISVNDMGGNLLGMVNVNAELIGSASVYPNVEDNDELFAVMITRDCKGSNFCMEISPSMGEDRSKYGPLTFSEDIILNPNTGTAPSEKEILVFRVLYGKFLGGALPRSIN